MLRQVLLRNRNTSTAACTLIPRLRDATPKEPPGGIFCGATAEDETHGDDIFTLVASVSWEVQKVSPDISVPNVQTPVRASRTGQVVMKPPRLALFQCSDSNVR